MNVVVHQLEAPKFEICADDNSATRTVHLSYHGEAHSLKFEFPCGAHGEAHYNSVRRKDDYSAEPSSGLPHIGAEAPRPASPEPVDAPEDRPPKPAGRRPRRRRGPAPAAAASAQEAMLPRRRPRARARQKARAPREDGYALAGEVGAPRARRRCVPPLPVRPDESE